MFRDSKVYEKGIYHFKQATKIKRYAAAHHDLGVLYREQGDREKTIAEYKKALEIDPQYTYSFINLGSIYFDVRRYAEAEELFKNSIKSAPTAAAYHNLGLVYRKTAKYEQAIEAYEEALRLYPSYMKVYDELSIIYRRLKKYDELVAVLKESLKLKPKDSTT